MPNAIKMWRKVHLVLGLISGLIIFVSILPASVFVWEEELTTMRDHDLIFVEGNKEKLPLSALLSIVKKEIDAIKTISGVYIYNDPARSYVFEAYKKAHDPGFSFFSEMDHWDKIYVNPYDGKVLGITNMKYDWIYLCRVIHLQLLLNYKVGHWPVAIATLIMFAMLISGIYLWLPKNMKTLRQRLKIKWNAKWRRVNFDSTILWAFIVLFSSFS